MHSTRSSDHLILSCVFGLVCSVIGILYSEIVTEPYMVRSTRLYLCIFMILLPKSLDALDAGWDLSRAPDPTILFWCMVGLGWQDYNLAWVVRHLSLYLPCHFKTSIFIYIVLLVKFFKVRKFGPRSCMCSPYEFSSHGLASRKKQQGDSFDGRCNGLCPFWNAAWNQNIIKSTNSRNTSCWM